MYHPLGVAIAGSGPTEHPGAPESRRRNSDDARESRNNARLWTSILLPFEYFPPALPRFEQGDPVAVLDDPKEERTKQFLRRTLQLPDSLEELTIDEEGVTE